MKGGYATRFVPVAEEPRSDHVLRASMRPFRGRTSSDVDELVVGTKIRRPLLPRDLVARTRLLSELEAGFESPLQVVAAPAGYGKTTLVSHWLEGTSRPSAWVSLGAEDDSLEAFVLHLVAAMRQMSPHGMGRVTSFIREGALPSPGALALALLNDLSDIEHAFVLVLDGTEVIRDRETLQLLSSLLEHPPAQMHLVLVGRWDPFLLFASMRVATRVAEIRARDLRFTPEETLALLERSRVAQPTLDAAEAWTAATEGWITGLKLAIDESAVATPGDPGVHALTRRVRAYLLSEVLGHQPDSVRRFLLDASILDRLCEPLCRALYDGPGEGRPDDVADRSLQLLRDQGLFLVPLDANGEWFRFHGLLRAVLTSLRERERDSERDANLRRRAAGWFASNGHLEEAVSHALGAGDPTLAAGVVEAHADRAMHAGAWNTLRRALQRLPVDVVGASRRLLVAQAWVNLQEGRLGDAETAVQRAERIASSGDGGFTSAIKSAIARARGDVRASIAWAREALSAECAQEPFDLGEAVTNLYAGYWVGGDRAAADSLAESVLAGARADLARGRERLLPLMCATRWRDGDLAGLEETTALCERLARDEELPRMMAVAELYRGLAGYERNELSRAREHLSAALAARGALTDDEELEARYGLARVHRAQGRHASALDVVGLKLKSLEDHGAEAARAAAWPHRALKAELLLTYCDPRTALALVEPRGGVPADAATSRFDPGLTLVRILLTQDDADSGRRARDVLVRFDDADPPRQGCRFRIEWHCLMALLAAREGDDEASVAQLREALALADKADFIRCLVDLGTPMVDLMKPLARDATHGRFVRRVLSAYYEDALASGALETGWEELAAAESAVDLLTPKESETLRLLAGGLANSEIAEQSFVSVDTVKTHLKNIYRKLHVRSRRQAVTRARAVGLLAEA